MSSRGPLRPLHRAKRFFTSLFPPAPTAEQTAWAHSHLDPLERPLFDAMAQVDRAHSIGVAKAVARHGGTGWLVAAALTHDVGKTTAGLGIIGRVIATLAAAVGATRFADRWMDRGGYLGRIGSYLDYPELGAAMLAGVGSDPRVVAWSAQHHEPEDRWTVPIDDGRMLVAADDGRLSP